MRVDVEGSLVKWPSVKRSDFPSFRMTSWPAKQNLLLVLEDSPGTTHDDESFHGTMVFGLAC